MTLREFLYKFHIELPTSEPLKGVNELPPHLSGQLFAAVPYKSEPEKREELFDTFKVNKNIVSIKGKILVPDVPYKIEVKVQRMISNKQRYLNIAHKFQNPIKWFHIGLIHELECSQNFNCYLGNGQPFNRKTTIVPKGRGAFSSFEAGAIDAIRYEGLDKEKDWSVGNFLYIAEGFNGYGYSKYKGINSPYIWSGTDKYISGRYIADSVYSKTTVSQQIGIAPLLRRLIELGQTK